MSVRVQRCDVAAYTVPTDFPEADGTLKWSATTLVVVHVHGGGRTGMGYSYIHRAAAQVIADHLAPAVEGKDAMAVQTAWRTMVGSVRNIGRQGVAASAIAAVDIALWDLKARLLGLSLADLAGRCRDAIPVYGSGGFTSYPPDRLQAQLAGWAEQGIGAVKMKVGSRPGEDAGRVAAARAAIGPEVELLVDANGAYDRKQALAFADRFAEQQVTWFEEPVSSDDLDGLRLIRDRAPAGMEITAGEYGYDAGYFRRMLAAGAVDVLQPDATRCLGVTGFQQAAALCAAFEVPLSAHTAPGIHAHLACAAPTARHTEYFHDHVRIEAALFDGALRPVEGRLHPDPARPGLGLELKAADAEAFRV